MKFILRALFLTIVSMILGVFLLFTDYFQSLKYLKEVQNEARPIRLTLLETNKFSTAGEFQQDNLSVSQKISQTRGVKQKMQQQQQLQHSNEAQCQIRSDKGIGIKSSLYYSNGASIAYFILMSRGERKKVTPLLQKILYPENIYLIHMDKKMNETDVKETVEEFQSLNTSQNIFLLSQYQSNYRGISGVDLEVTAMAYALSLPMHWTHYIILSPSDYPLLTQEQILTLLTQLPQNLTLVEAHVMDCIYVQQRIKSVKFDYALVGDGNEKVSNTRFKTQQPKNLKIIKGSQWKLVTREMAKYFAHSEDGFARRLLLLFTSSSSASEHYFQTTVCNSPVVKDWVRLGVTTYKNWDNIDWAYRRKINNQGPNYMNETLLSTALNKGFFFARKFNQDEQGNQLKDMLDRMHAGEKITVNDTVYTKQSVFEHAQQYYGWAFSEKGRTCWDINQDDKKQPC